MPPSYASILCLSPMPLASILCLDQSYFPSLNSMQCATVIGSRRNRKDRRPMLGVDFSMENSAHYCATPIVLRRSACNMHHPDRLVTTTFKILLQLTSAPCHGTCYKSSSFLPLSQVSLYFSIHFICCISSSIQTLLHS